jgi:hypothetical protein
VVSGICVMQETCIHVPLLVPYREVVVHNNMLSIPDLRSNQSMNQSCDCLFSAFPANILSPKFEPSGLKPKGKFIP